MNNDNPFKKRQVLRHFVFFELLAQRKLNWGAQANVLSQNMIDGTW